MLFVFAWSFNSYFLFDIPCRRLREEMSCF